MQIDLTTNHFGSLSQNVPEMKLVNLYLAQNPLTPTGFSFVARPTLSEEFTLPGTAIRGVYYQQGNISGDQLLVVVDESLYKVDDNGVSTFIGHIYGGGECRFASTIYYIAILSGGQLYLYDGTNLTTADTPDRIPVKDIDTLLNYVIVAIRGSNQFYWIRPGELEIDPLSFASAEGNPDNIQAVKTTSDELWLIGNTTTEVWSASGIADAPFIRITGRIFNLGCIDVASTSKGIKNSLPCLLWVSDSKQVILAQGAPSRISNEYIEEKIRASSTYHSWFFTRNRNDFYALTTDQGTFVYDVTNDRWYKWSSYNSVTWKASAGVQKNDQLFAIELFGEPKLWKLKNGNKDISTEWLVCEVSGFIPNPTKKTIPCSLITLFCNTGYSTTYTEAPVVELRWSDDNGANWSNYKQTTLGSRGETNSEVVFRSLGSFMAPGRRIEVRFSGVEDFRLDYASMNWD